VVPEAVRRAELAKTKTAKTVKIEKAKMVVKTAPRMAVVPVMVVATSSPTNIEDNDDDDDVCDCSVDGINCTESAHG
jgi:hypothetical protein